MGVPVLTMAGYNFNSRCGESINKNLNLEYLIAKDEEEYISKATNLSNNKKFFFELRKFIYVEGLKSPLFDQKKFSKSFFKALEEIAN